MDFDVVTSESIKVSVRTPKRYKVVLHNDDTTEMTAVVAVLVMVFKKSFEVATTLMLQVHNEGKGVVDIYPKKLADARCKEALEFVHSMGYKDFKVTVEEE